jgi:methionyl-tRNA formyltransferase
MKLLPSPVKALAQAHAIALDQPATLKSAQSQQALRDFAPDVLVVAAYGLILPQAVLDIPKHGCINVHASLLPRWRGAAPIQRALLAGDVQTGVTIMQMDAGLDTGYMLLSRSYTISQSDTYGSVETRLAQLGAEALLEALTLLERGSLKPSAQPAEGATYAAKVHKDEARLDFTQSALQLDRVVRAFNPTPVAHTLFRGELLRVWRAAPLAGGSNGKPVGMIEVLGDGAVSVVCGGGGALMLTDVQRAGGKPMSAAAWAAGAKPQAGERFGI